MNDGTHRRLEACSLKCPMSTLCLRLWSVKATHGAPSSRFAGAYASGAAGGPGGISSSISSGGSFVEDARDLHRWLAA